MRLKDSLAKGRMIKDLLTQNTEMSLQIEGGLGPARDLSSEMLGSSHQSHGESNVSKKR